MKSITEEELVASRQKSFEETGDHQEMTEDSSGSENSGTEPKEDESPLEVEEEDLQEELRKAREEAQALEDRVLRMAAELENFKKRMQRERETALKYAEENILRELLPTIDNLERAIEQGKSSGGNEGLLEGVEMTLKGLMATLEKFGLKPVEGAGRPFDPNFHEALAMEESDEFDENTVMREFMKGYMFKDRLLRAAKVVVSKGKKNG